MPRKSDDLESYRILGPDVRLSLQLEETITDVRLHYTVINKVLRDLLEPCFLELKRTDQPEQVLFTPEEYVTRWPEGRLPLRILNKRCIDMRHTQLLFHRGDYHRISSLRELRAFLDGWHGRTPYAWFTKNDIWSRVGKSDFGTYLFAGALWDLTKSDVLLNDEQLRLVFADGSDKERRRWEKLKRRYSNSATPVEAPRREAITQEVRMFVWRRDKGRCVQCGSQENLEFDHLIPVSKGGSSTARNIQLLCERCNREKGAFI